jgi:hypothetical protein
MEGFFENPEIVELFNSKELDISLYENYRF